jgi:hypothetical protein
MASTILAYEVHPAIGIARLGKSETGYFIGPEPAVDNNAYRETGGVVTNVARTPPPSRFRDDKQQLMRQAARFRVFQVERGENGATIKREVAAGTQVQWSIELANRKAAAPTFASRQSEKRPPRNPGRDEEELVIRARADVTRGEFPGHRLTGEFLGASVKLGDAWHDNNRLYVLGGHGESGSPEGKEIGNFADNEGWYDDTSDGPVFAKVFANGKWQNAKPAWVIVAPFDFAPEIQSFITLYDIAHSVALKKNWLPGAQRTEFKRDVLPLLRRVREYRWVNGPSIRAETQDRHAAWATPEKLAALGDRNNASSDRWRHQLFRHLMPPASVAADPVRQVRMPRLYGDEPYPAKDQVDTNAVMPLLEHQYEHMRRWANGDFDSSEPSRREYLCDALDRIALEACCGGAFHPGIDAPRLIRNPHIYSEAFRLKPSSGGYESVPAEDSAAPFKGLVAGQITEGLAVPWQADFWDCQQERGNAWWPASRPDDVMSAKHPPSVALDSVSDFTVRWDYGIEGYADMVNHWSELGIVRRREAVLEEAPDFEFDSRNYNAETDSAGVRRFYYYGETERLLEETPGRFAHFPKKDESA